MTFLKSARLMAQDTKPQYVNKMTVLNLQEDVQRRAENYGADFIGAVMSRTSCLMSLCHAKKLLSTHGYESFAEYIINFFDLTKKGKTNVKFLKNIKEQPVYDKFITYLTESRSTKNHPKLRKLAEILIEFF